MLKVDTNKAGLPSHKEFLKIANDWINEGHGGAYIKARLSEEFKIHVNANMIEIFLPDDHFTSDYLDPEEVATDDLFYLVSAVLTYGWPFDRYNLEVWRTEELFYYTCDLIGSGALHLGPVSDYIGS